jgi:hypothetical protein
MQRFTLSSDRPPSTRKIRHEGDQTREPRQSVSNFSVVCRALPRVLHRTGKFLPGQRIQHVLFGETGTPGLSDAVTQFFHVRSVVRIGVDDDFHTMLFGQAQMNVVEVEPIGIGVQFHRHFVFGRRLENRVEIELVGVATQQQASGGMPGQRGISLEIQNAIWNAEDVQSGFLACAFTPNAWGRHNLLFQCLKSNSEIQRLKADSF